MYYPQIHGQLDSSASGDLLAVASSGSMGVFDTTANKLLSHVTVTESKLLSAGFDAKGK